MPEDKEIRKEEVVPVVETMERETVKKCCVASGEVKPVCHCCLRLWSL